MAVSEEHKALCTLGVKWFKTNGFPVIASGIGAFGSREIPDVIAFRSSASALIEVKVSRGDFLKDKKKAFRDFGGIGTYRFYLCPEGMITVDELPYGWGLLYEKDGKIIDVHRPSGNLWVGYHFKDDDWDGFKHEVNLEAEWSVLFSISRRMSKGESLHRG